MLNVRTKNFAILANFFVRTKNFAILANFFVRTLIADIHFGRVPLFGYVPNDTGMHADENAHHVRMHAEENVRTHYCWLK